MKTLKQLAKVTLTLWSFMVMGHQGINYKALIKDNGRNMVDNQSITVQFQILEGVSETNVYQETHSPTTDAIGIVKVNIGEGTPASGDYATIDWGSDDHYLNVQINTGGGGGNWEITGSKTPGTIAMTSASGKTTVCKYESCGNGCYFFGNVKYAYAGKPECR